MNETKIASDKSPVVAELPLACSNEKAAADFLERQRWSGEPRCPHCGSARVYQMRDRKTGERNQRFLWRCSIPPCGRQFTVRVGTVLEDSAIPLRHWCYAFWAACSSKKGISALQIKRQTGLSYKSALFLMHRIRYALAEDPITPAHLEGTIEVDESYVGGKPRHKGPHTKRGHGTKKRPIVALLQRNGDVRARVPRRISAASVREAIIQNVNPQHARLITDEAWIYTKIGRKFSGGHDTINHARKEYVRGDVTTNTVEGFFSLVKRGLYGTFHSVSPEHLHRYLAEFEYRYNTRKLDDGERTARAIRKAEGKRLRYRLPVGA